MAGISEKSNLTRNSWRLLINHPSPGSWNMAVDEALLKRVGAGQSPPVLRLYAWEPACLSLGMAQPAADIDFPSLQAQGWDWVRRPTGGRAILHTRELTYAVIVPPDEPRLAGSVLQSYLRISEALLRALDILGLAASARSGESNPPGDHQVPGPVCFEVPSAYEITVFGKKLIGSAQARRREGVLQHGSLPLCGDLTCITQALVYSDQENRLQAGIRLLEHALTLESALGKLVAWETAAAAVVQAFSECLNLEFISQELSPEEEALASEICREKYSNPVWNARI